MGALPGWNSKVRVAGATTPTLTNEACSLVSGTTFQVTDPTKRVLHPSAAITVKDNGATQSSGYTVDRLYGLVVFDSAPTGPVTVSGTYVTLTDLAEVEGWRVDPSRTMESDKAMDGSPWDSVMGATFSVRGSFDRFYADGDDWVFSHLDNDAVLVGVFHADPTTEVCRAWLRLENISNTSSVRGLVKSNVTFVGAPDADGRSFSYGP